MNPSQVIKMKLTRNCYNAADAYIFGIDLFTPKKDKKLPNVKPKRNACRRSSSSPLIVALMVRRIQMGETQSNPMEKLETESPWELSNDVINMLALCAVELQTATKHGRPIQIVHSTSPYSKGIAVGRSFTTVTVRLFQHSVVPTKSIITHTSQSNLGSSFIHAETWAMMAIELFFVPLFCFFLVLSLCTRNNPVWYCNASIPITTQFSITIHSSQSNLGPTFIRTGIGEMIEKDHFSFVIAVLLIYQQQISTQ